MSVRQEYTLLLRSIKVKIDESTFRQNSTEFQNELVNIIGKLLSLKDKVYHHLALFSDNESLDDISTSSLEFLSIDYYLAYLCSKKQVVSTQINDDSSKNRMKLKFLEKSVQLYIQFLITLQESEILDKYLAKKLDAFEETYKPRLSELYNVTVKDQNDMAGAMLKRQQKIEGFKNARAVEAQLKELEKRIAVREDVDIDTNDDELLREIYIQKLKVLSYTSFNEIEQILYESELLANFLKEPVLQEVKEDNETQPEENSTGGYTERLETLNKPLLSKTGKILRNFTLMDKKTQLQKKVKGYGQYGPTMTVEEFLEKEFEEGRVLQGGEEQPEEHDSDDDEWLDKETYKAREWDEFKEANQKGSGNTINRG
ncbi:hypothetical protein TPHA_0C02680 [Tetrapisispora phaffii CBS 4417]|uniref:Uncharacterized protein n=1 Tax=Tetrapisispora phaffii (strain ATCC 24235 / CBS 4417 / NBRC 1672 / NRRL Y-8282 / UCD 70-5) TaxID=1071381 RepID=G8BRP5_TETPH|nr:hypothetical protein TPHA_0C02680 [Tetrapisispora phaffii CBS 4417]CCE62421.1 hypothetical protein TPHA_0C02680 [Tetrapisispora phaffii CBS 4417]